MMPHDRMLQASAVAVIGGAGALAQAHLMDPSLVTVIAGVVNFLLGLFHSKPAAK